MNKETIQQFFREKGRYLALAVLVLIAGGFFLWHSQKKTTEHDHGSMDYPTSFFVTALDFNQSMIGNAPTSQSIIINFSQPVTPETLNSFFEINPNIKGSFQKGSNDTEVLFLAETPFESGVNYTVRINSGLMSTMGVALAEDFSKVLSLRFSADDFKILKSDRYSLLQSVYIEDVGSVRAQVGTNIKNPQVKIFKTTNPEIVLRDIMAYVNAPYSESGPQFKTDTSKLTAVSTTENVAHNSEIPLPKEIGTYLVQAVSEGKVLSETWFTVNTFGVHFRQDDQKFIVAAQDLGNGEPVSGMEITTYKTENQTLARQQRLTFSGLAEFPLVYPNFIDIAVVKKGNEYAYVPVRINGSLAELRVYQNLSDSWQGFMYTERPIYKTKDTVKFRGLLRIDNDGQYKLPEPGTQVVIGIQPESYVEGNGSIPERLFTVNEHGVYFGEFNIDGSLKPGRYFMTARLQNNPDSYIVGGQAWFEILEYKKPPFGLTLSTDKEEYIEGDTAQVVVKASNFDGSSFGKQTITYKVYAMDFYETEKAVYNKSFALNGWGGMCGGGGYSPFETYYGEVIPGSEQEVITNASGEAKLTFDTKKLERNISQVLTFVVEKKDANGNIISEARSAVVHNGEINIFVRSFKNQSKQSQVPAAVFSAETLSGEKLKNQTFDYQINQVKYDYTNSGSNRIVKPLRSGKTTTNNEGVGQFAVEGINNLETGFDVVEVNVTKADGRGNTITGSQNFYMYGGNYQYEVPVLLSITSLQTNLVPGQNMRLSITAPEDLKVLVAFERGRVQDTQWLDVKKGEHVYEFPVKDSYMPTITPTFSAFYKNHYYVEGLTFNVPAMKKLQNISVVTDKSEYKAGETAKVTITVKDSEGKPMQTSLSLGVIDKAIFALRKSTTLPIHSSFYFFRPRRTNNSSSMTGVSFGEGAEQGGGGGAESNIFGKDVDVLYWNPELMTNASGQVVVEIPVVGNTVWKGVVYSATDTTDVGQADFEFSSK